MLSSAQIMIIIITPLSFIPAMNIYETALLDGPNWKTIYVARMGWGGGANAGHNGGGFALVPYFCSLFIIFQATMKAPLGRAIKAN